MNKLKPMKVILSAILAISMLAEGSICTAFAEENEMSEEIIESVADYEEELIFADSDLSPDAKTDKVITTAAYTLIEGDTASIEISGVSSNDIQIKGKAGTYSNGVFTAVKKGNAKLFVLDGTKKKVVCKIKVERPKIKAKLSLKQGKTKKLKLSGTKTPVEKWTTSDENVVTVTSDGSVSAVAAGTANITAYIGKHNYVCAVTVKNGKSSQKKSGKKGKVGMSFPNDLYRWKKDVNLIKSELEKNGYTVDLQYAYNDVQAQALQINNMISNGDSVLIIAAVNGETLGEAMAKAKKANIPVIAYDRLIKNSDAVSYYASFDNYMIGTKQGQFIVDALDLDNEEGPFTMEITSGDPEDSYAEYYYNGAMDVLKPYINSGKITIPSGQTDFASTATIAWSSDEAIKRMEDILYRYYRGGVNLDIALCANDSTALGVENALEAEDNYTGSYPIVTGQDCDVANVKNILAGKQSMSVFRDTRVLATQTVKMTMQVLDGKSVDVNATTNNGSKSVPSYLCEPMVITKDNYRVLIDYNPEAYSGL